MGSGTGRLSSVDCDVITNHSYAGYISRLVTNSRPGSKGLLISSTSQQLLMS